MMNLQQTMEALYASEINCEISCFWDGWWDVYLGDSMNGYRAEATFQHLDDAPAWMISQAIKHWPDSEFAKSHAKPVDNAQGS